MADPTLEFFRRDLDDAEWRDLGELLAKDGAAADRFLEAAASYYQQLGLPEPRPPRLKGAWAAAKGMVLGLGVGLALGSGVTAWILGSRTQEPLPPPQATPAAPGQALQTAAAPVAQATAVPTAALRSTPLSIPTLAQPQAAVAGAHTVSPGFPGLEAVIILARQGLVTARVLDAGGQEVRQLYAGVLDAGQWRFGWDGRDEAGRGVQPGLYTISVQEGSRVLKKRVQLDAKVPLVGP